MQRQAMRIRPFLSTTSFPDSDRFSNSFVTLMSVAGAAGDGAVCPFRILHFGVDVISA